MKIGFTGTRHGATILQLDFLGTLLGAPDVKELHHGDCVGADAQAHDAVMHAAKLGLAQIYIHPPVDETHRAFCKDADICVCWHGPGRHQQDPQSRLPLGECWGNGAKCGCKLYVRRTDQVVWLPPKTYFARNRDIVDAADLLIATPFNNFEEDRGGTWYTVNYARKRKKPIVIVWPTGKATIERFTC